MNRFISLFALFALEIVGCDTNHECSTFPPIDSALATPSPEQFQDLTGCQPQTFDITNALNVADDGSLTIVWLLAHESGAHETPEEVNRLQLTIDTCRNPRVVVGRVTTLEAVVLQGEVPIATLSDADEVKKLARNEGSGNSVIWFFGINTNSCCQ